MEWWDYIAIAVLLWLYAEGIVARVRYEIYKRIEHLEKKLSGQ